MNSMGPAGVLGTPPGAKWYSLLVDGLDHDEFVTVGPNCDPNISLQWLKLFDFQGKMAKMARCPR